ncbi:MAG: recombinase XerD, partial [Hungatella sp.]|nr:recombinase XerD [Hungatella sp.]
SEILGHSSVKITMDIYVHSNMEQKKSYMNRMV